MESQEPASPLLCQWNRVNFKVKVWMWRWNSIIYEWCVVMWNQRAPRASYFCKLCCKEAHCEGNIVWFLHAGLSHLRSSCLQLDFIFHIPMGRKREDVWLYLMWVLFPSVFRIFLGLKWGGGGGGGTGVYCNNTAFHQDNTVQLSVRLSPPQWMRASKSTPCRFSTSFTFFYLTQNFLIVCCRSLLLQQ